METLTVVLIFFTGVLIFLTGTLIFYSRRLDRSSGKLLGAMKDLKKTAGELSNIGLEYVGASMKREVRIPYSFLREDLELLKSMMKVVEQVGRVSCNWEDDSLKITYGLNRLPVVLEVLLANAREPNLLYMKLAVDPLSILVCESYTREQAMEKEFTKQQT